MPWVILASHISHEGVCKTSAGSAARWLSSAGDSRQLASSVSFVLPGAPSRSCVKREVAVFPQLPLSRSALTKRCRRTGMKSEHAIEITLLFCAAEVL